MKRNISLDITRTFAILLMVVFHFIYDLKFFNVIEWNIPDGDGWRHFRWLIISLFFLCLGVSLTFAHGAYFSAKKFSTRTLQISLAALVISIATYFAIPQNWIFFGVLHFLAFSSLLVVGLVRFPKLCFVIGVSIILLGMSQVLPSRWPFHLIFSSLPSYTNDYVAIQPWLGMVFLGVTLAHTRFIKRDPLLNFFNHSPPWLKLSLIWPGQHSLSIYLLHQPILMGTLYVFTLA